MLSKHSPSLSVLHYVTVSPKSIQLCSFLFNISFYGLRKISTYILGEPFFIRKGSIQYLLEFFFQDWPMTSLFPNQSCVSWHSSIYYYFFSVDDFYCIAFGDKAKVTAIFFDFFFFLLGSFLYLVDSYLRLLRGTSIFAEHDTLLPLAIYQVVY